MKNCVKCGKKKILAEFPMYLKDNVWKPGDTCRDCSDTWADEIYMDLKIEEKIVTKKINTITQQLKKLKEQKERYQKRIKTLQKNIKEIESKIKNKSIDKKHYDSELANIKRNIRLDELEKEPGKGTEEYKKFQRRKAFKRWYYNNRNEFNRKRKKDKGKNE